MTSHAEDDIVRRALVGVLMPESNSLQATIKTRQVRTERLRLTKRLPNDLFKPVDVVPQPLNVSVLERLSSKSLIVSWSDPCSGKYGNPVWRFGLARVDSFCVLTGMPICRGDPVFRPRVSPTSIPANHNWMILVSEISAIPV
ncbi:uncharacterized protein DUF3331 [Paraburkholderia sp. BL23I1N1]|uniref:DUF3331 domain-containing protein n=1 Tax=Paraburkholderia sp. BL23I1N1 TaxID=1938802 RepID=UPI000E77378E|nr:DUF3331 domain-containing protein [Paraburkholderia sp. BL23I1N1]RKE36408.1 uncharacterized protein DUF3331 [Paraburkholderia sp. BL23I1N1]